MAIIDRLDDIERVLSDARTIAVLGAHDDLARPAGYVPDYLHRKGYTIYPVNPMKVGMTLWGQPVRATLAELSEPIDMVDVFRRSSDVAGHLDDLLAMAPLPKVVWLQLGIRNDAVAAALVARGIEVVQDRCTYADHRLLGLPAK